MNISRNALCRCGSGKKFKRCCASSKGYKLGAVKCSHENQNNDEVVNDGGMDEMPKNMSNDDFHQMMLSIYQRIRLDNLKRLEHVKHYKIARNMHQEIVDSMVDFYEQGKFEQRIDPYYSKEYEDRTGKFEIIDCEYDLTTELGVKAFYDILIYKISPNMNCITEVFIEKNRYRKPEKIAFLHSMLDSTIGLFEIINVEKEMAYVAIKHIFTGDEFKITDIGISGSPGFDKNYIYTRIITYGETSFGTGLNMIFSKDDPFIQRFIAKEKKDYKPLGDLLRTTKLYKQLVSVGTEVKTTSSNPFERK